MNKYKAILLNRTRLLLVVFFVLGAAAGVRLFYLQILNKDYFETVGREQYQVAQVLIQRRGEIFMHDLKSAELIPVAINRKLALLFAVPKEIKDEEKVAKELAFALLDKEGDCRELLDAQKTTVDILLKCEQRKKMEDEILAKIIEKNDPYEPLRHEVDEATVSRIRDLNLAGIYFEDEWTRYYPAAEALAQVSGFLGYAGSKRVGQYGTEGFFEAELAGEAGKLLGDRDLFGRLIPSAEQELKEVKNGDQIVLTLDRVIQSKANEIITEAVKKYEAEHGTIVVLDPATGEIKAMAGYPNFDPNKYSEVESPEAYKNKNVGEAYEPGSVFKVFTMAIGLDSGQIETDETYEDKGFVQLGEHIIKNAGEKKYGVINMTQVLENSVNTGAIYIARKTGRETFNKYLSELGFGKLFGMGISGEEKGDISSLDKKGEIYLATASYGQGIMTTAVQLASALATIVNNGKLVAPKIIERVGDNNYINNGVVSGIQVFSERTCQIVKAMMVSVVLNGHAKAAQVPGYYIGGKTGTAEIASQGGYSHENNHTFIGFGPLANTKFVMVVKLAKPKVGQYAESTAVPTFQKMANFLLNYYGVAPEISINR